MSLHRLVKEREAAQAIRKMSLGWRLWATLILLCKMAGLVGMIYGAWLMLHG